MFRDAENDSLSYGATSTNIRTATVSVVAGTLTVMPVGVGTVTVRLTAADGHGGLVTTSFGVTVTAASALTGELDGNGVVDQNDALLFAARLRAAKSTGVYDAGLEVPMPGLGGATRRHRDRAVHGRRDPERTRPRGNGAIVFSPWEV